MRELGSILLSCSIIVGMRLPATYGQDAQSLGDVARQTRQQKQQKDAPEAQTPKAARVITDDEMPTHAGQPAQTSTPDRPAQQSGSPATSAEGKKLSAEEWKRRILAQKGLINSGQEKIDKLKASVHYSAYGNVARNKLQNEKLQQIERWETQLNDQKKRLEEMQEAARRQGYGNPVYDP